MPEKILFVEDEADFSLMISNCLRLYGHEVVTAENPELALKLADKFAADVVILDVNLSDLKGRDGANLMSALKQKHPHTPIILYTGMSADDEEVRDMLEQGAFIHVSKSETLEVLRIALHKAAQYSLQNN